MGDAAVPASGLTSGDRAPPVARIARLFASPAAVLVILPALVIAAGVTVMLLGRRATQDTAENMAKNQCVATAQAVRGDVESAVDQADPVFKMMSGLANSAMPTQDALSRLHDIVIGRPVTNASIVFPIGVMWQTFRDKEHPKETRVQETRVGDTQTTRTSFEIIDGDTKQMGDVEISDYDPRTRPYYIEAVKAKKRVWLPPRVFSSSGKTGVTVAEPVLTPTGEVAAVLVLDYDAAELSALLRQPPLAGARSVVFTRDGTILAYPSAQVPEAAI
ncbi:MAG TPA: cache domain-containing protein, partial [Kofleriaceae bacterium]|nr:cache domain-containing protein [Kofleriaceae bacterium]